MPVFNFYREKKEKKMKETKRQMVKMLLWFLISLCSHF